MCDEKLKPCDEVCGVRLSAAEMACQYTVEEMCGGRDPKESACDEGGNDGV